ncbi:GspE/PulE family protein [Mangrovitalea sediminis]|uniref:GspE/PulE family protein n=1 Tax=Mangrovitalea sediminis TaxID=1982043 RepID=UPI000BE5E706|nr:type II/IV secretion system protein [Mangrovitalea sediminis]
MTDIQQVSSTQFHHPFQPVITSADELRRHHNTQYRYTPRPLGEVLLDMQIITTAQLSEALEEQKISHLRLGETLQQMGIVTQEQILRGFSEHFGVPYITLRHFDVETRALACVPASFARKHMVVPLLLEGDRLLIALQDPTDTDLVNMLRFITGKVLELCISSPDDIGYAIAAHYGGQEMQSALDDMDVVVEKEPFHLDVNAEEQLGHERPIVQLVKNMITEALVRRASDIHIRPQESGVDLYFRVDGVLQKVRSFDKKLLPAVVSRLKILGNMDISEHRVPQDGRTRIHYMQKTVDLRLSVIPAIHGESVVIRLLDTQFALKNLEQLGFEDADAQRLRHLLTRNNGIFLVTGPTGSGKSTTLYTALGHLKNSNVNIITVEDPVEYHLNGITQIQVNHATDYTFARALRHILRHDPDVVMVGEIRDQETAKMAVESALTGHLVLSTLHTNDAATSVTRLIEIGVEPYLVNSALIGVLAQRLVRRTCPECKAPEPTDPEMCRILGVPEDETFFHGLGCDHCNGTGISGRMAVYELLEVTPELRKLIGQDVAADVIEQQAVRDGMTRLTDSALKLARDGHISLAEVYRVRL